MKKSMVVLVLVLCWTCGLVRIADADVSPGFEKLKMLVGDWEGLDTQENALRVSYKLVSNGTALMETLNVANKEEMITMYTADGDQVALTHYCSANNQPRMRTVPSAIGLQELEFVFAGATNLPGPGVGHMHRLVLSFQDSDHFTQEWTWRESGKADAIKIFRFTRKQ